MAVRGGAGSLFICSFVPDLEVSMTSMTYDLENLG